MSRSSRRGGGIGGRSRDSNNRQFKGMGTHKRSRKPPTRVSPRQKLAQNTGNSQTGMGGANLVINLPVSDEETITHNNTLNSSSFDDTLRIIFGNVNGLNNSKRTRLAAMTQSDHIICLNETNYSENDTLLLTKSGLGDIAKIKSLDHIAYKKGNVRRQQLMVNDLGNVVATARLSFADYLILYQLVNLAAKKNLYMLF